MSYSIFRHQLHFKKPSGTSRGVLNVKLSFHLASWKGGLLQGVGEVSLIQKLSPEMPDLIPQEIDAALDSESWRMYCLKNQLPAVQFGLEMYHLSNASHDPFELYPSEFVEGKVGIPINGLIWMGDREFMFNQIEQKIKEGFTCLKLKIGAIDFEEELDLIKYVRSQFEKSDVEIRVDANGAFAPDDALEKLNRLSEYDLHSIEQPIRQGQAESMAALCRNSPLDIALDEEIIGISTSREKEVLLSTIQPQYIILKPSLIGGIKEAEDWIECAEKQNIRWWATSALESNIGLNAIAQWTFAKAVTMYQGLGTGGLYTNNIESPLFVKEGHLWYNIEKNWNTQFFIS